MQIPNFLLSVIVFLCIPHYTNAAASSSQNTGTLFLHTTCGHLLFQGSQAYAGTPGFQSNHCSHKEPWKGTPHKSFSVVGKKDSQVSLSEVKCSKYISDSRITQDTVLLDTHTSADTFRNFSPKTCHTVFC